MEPKSRVQPMMDELRIYALECFILDDTMKVS